jgi:hypothetical protein
MAPAAIPAATSTEEIMHHQHHPAERGTSPRRRFTRAAIKLSAVAGVVLAGAAPAAAWTNGSSNHHGQRHHDPAIKLVAVTPQPGDTAGDGGTFNVDLALLAQNQNGNNLLSAANGYHSGLNLPPATTFGPGMPDPDVPGLVVTLSTTPQAAGGPNANLAGVFQLNATAKSRGLKQVFTDWEVGSPGFFGANKQTTLTAYVVRGTAPGIVTGNERPISNVITETFTIGG